MKKRNILSDGIRLYLFGSALSASNPDDIDLLLAYDSTSIGFGVIVDVRKKLQKTLLEYLNKSIDICLLSQNELASNSFVEDEKAKLIYG